MITSYITAAAIIVAVVAFWVFVERAWRRVFAGTELAARCRGCAGCMCMRRGLTVDDDDAETAAKDYP